MYSILQDCFISEIRVISGQVLYVLPSKFRGSPNVTHKMFAKPLRVLHCAAKSSTIKSGTGQMSSSKKRISVSLELSTHRKLEYNAERLKYSSVSSFANLLIAEKLSEYPDPPPEQEPYLPLKDP